MTGEPCNDEALAGPGINRRDLIRRIVAGTAFAVPIIASFDMSSLTVSAADAYGPNQFGTAPTITSGGSATFVVGTVASFTVTTSGGKYLTISIEVSGQVPNGITFTDNGDGTATLGGTPAAGSGGVYDLTLTAADGVPPNATQSFVLTVKEAPAFTSPSTLALRTGGSGSLQIEATGDPRPTITQAGHLPTGVGFKADPENGTAIIAGLPATNAGGLYKVTLTAANGVGSGASQTLTVIVDEAISVLGPKTTTFTAGHAGHVTFTATGFPVPSVQTSGRPPKGMLLTAAADGVVRISGTPAKGSEGRYVIRVTASARGHGTVSQQFTITVKAAPTNKQGNS